MKTIIKTTLITATALLLAQPATGAELALRFTAEYSNYDYDEYIDEPEDIVYVALPRISVHYEPCWMSDGYPWWIDTDWFFYCHWPRRSWYVDFGFNDWWPIFSYHRFHHRPVHHWPFYHQFRSRHQFAFYHQQFGGYGVWDRHYGRPNKHDIDFKPFNRYDKKRDFRNKKSDWLAHRPDNRRNDHADERDNFGRGNYRDQRKHDQDFNRKDKSQQRKQEQEKLRRNSHAQQFKYNQGYGRSDFSHKPREEKNIQNRSSNRDQRAWQQPKEQRDRSKSDWHRQQSDIRSTPKPRYESKKTEQPAWQTEQRRTAQRPERIQRSSQSDRDKQKSGNRHETTSRIQRDRSHTQTQASSGRENRSGREMASRREQGRHRR